MQHGDEQPLRRHFAIGAAKFRHICMHGQFLAGNEDIGENNRRHNALHAGYFARRFGQSRMVHKRLNTRRFHLITIGIGLAEIIGARRSGAHIVLVFATVHAMRDIVKGSVKALRQIFANAVIFSLIGVRPETAEILGQTQHGGSIVFGQKRIQMIVMRAHGRPPSICANVAEK